MSVKEYFRSLAEKREVRNELLKAARNFAGPFLDLPFYSTVREGCFLVGKFESAVVKSE